MTSGANLVGLVCLALLLRTTSALGCCVDSALATCLQSNDSTACADYYATFVDLECCALVQCTHFAKVRNQTGAPVDCSKFVNADGGGGGGSAYDYSTPTPTVATTADTIAAVPQFTIAKPTAPIQLASQRSASGPATCAMSAVFAQCAPFGSNMRASARCNAAHRCVFQTPGAFVDVECEASTCLASDSAVGAPCACDCACVGFSGSSVQTRDCTGQCTRPVDNSNVWW